MFVNKKYQRQGVASITAKPSFEQRGYKVLKEQKVIRNRWYAAVDYLENWVYNDIICLKTIR